MDKGLTIVSYEPAKMEFEKNVNRVKVLGLLIFIFQILIYLK